MRHALSVAATVLAAGCLAACSARPQGPHIVVPGGQFLGAGVAYPNTHRGTPYVFGDIVLCLDKPGVVTINNVELIGATNGLRIDDFAVIPNVMESGHEGYFDNSVPIAQVNPRPARPVVMTKKCPKSGNEPPRPDPQTVALLLQYSKTIDRNATSQAIKINYTTAGRKESLALEWQVALCAKLTGTGDEQCAPDGT